MIAAGAGAGVAAGFGAPMSGVLFAVETMLLNPAASNARTQGAPHGTAAAAAGSNDDDGGVQVRQSFPACIESNHVCLWLYYRKFEHCTIDF